MTSFQRVIKYIALAFAVSLIVGIFSTIINVFGFIFSFDNDEPEEELTSAETIKLDDIKNLDIDLATVNLIIENGSEMKVESNTKKIKYTTNNGKLSIKEGRNYNIKANKTLKITIPSDLMLDNVSIENGAGIINIDKLVTNNLNLELGAGKSTISNLVAYRSTDIEGGAGNLIIDSANINDLDLDMGVGKLELSGILTGKNSIDAGVGVLNINLLDSITNYNIKVSKGIGEIKLNDSAISNNYTIGNGINSIMIDGGVGSININTK